MDYPIRLKLSANIDPRTGGSFLQNRLAKLANNKGAGPLVLEMEDGKPVIKGSDGTLVSAKAYMEQKYKGKMRTNEEILLDLMNYSEFGGMNQAFIMSAIRSYCQTIMDAPVGPEVEGQVVSPQMWHDMAQDNFERIEAMYKANNS